MGADNLLKILNSQEPMETVEEWLEMAGTVLYLSATGGVASDNPKGMQEYVNHLVARMPEPLLIVSALRAKEFLDKV